MSEELITFETAKVAKEKKFNEPCVNGFSSIGVPHELNLAFENCVTNTEIDEATNEGYYLWEGYTRPTQTILHKWLRENFKINISMDFKPNINKWDYRVYDMTLNGKMNCIDYIRYYKAHPNRRFDTFEEALESGLLEALILIKN